MDEKEAKCIYIPKGLGHGFIVLEEHTTFLYKTTDYFFPEFDKGIKWNDTELNINWELDKYRIDKVIISKRDTSLPSFKEYFEL